MLLVIGAMTNGPKTEVAPRRPINQTPGEEQEREEQDGGGRRRRRRRRRSIREEEEEEKEEKEEAQGGGGEAKIRQRSLEERKKVRLHVSEIGCDGGEGEYRGTTMGGADECSKVGWEECDGRMRGARCGACIPCYVACR